MDAFRHSFRRQCTVRSFTLRPLEVAQALGFPGEVQALLPDYMDAPGLETPEEEAMLGLRRRWSTLVQEGTIKDGNAHFAAGWVRSNACVRRAYDPLEIAAALHELGLLAFEEGQKVDCMGLTSSRCAALLPCLPSP